MTEQVTVLVTGSAGRIGQAVVRELKVRRYQVRGFDRVPTRGVDEDCPGNLTDADAVRKATAGVRAVIHLAATPDDDDFLSQIVPNNLIGVHHVVEAAREAGVKRLVLASSGQVVWWQRFRGPWPITSDVQPTPRGWYAAAKCFLEAAGRVAAEAYGLSVLSVRLGWCPRTPEQAREIAVTDWAQDVYLSPGDAGRFFACSIEPKTEVPYAVVYACSRPAQRMLYDPAPARELLGYEPQDTWPQGTEEMLR
jgi:nucleoside-diphosphate-sugar epimerase